MQKKFVPVVLFALVSFAGCGGDSPAPSSPAPEDSSAQSSPSEPAPAPATSGSATAGFSMEDIERWKRGMEAELKAVQAAAAKLAQAADENAKAEALSDATEMRTIDAGASAAGVDRDQYRRIKNTMSNAVSQLSPIEMEMDVASMPAEMVEQMQQARSASAAQLGAELPADVLEALKLRAAELREQDKLLVAERLKVATAAR